MAEATSDPTVSNEVVLVAIVNKDTLADKLQEQAAITLISSLITAIITFGTPVVVNKITEYRTKKALAKRTQDLTEKKD